MPRGRAPSAAVAAASRRSRTGPSGTDQRRAPGRAARPARAGRARPRRRRAVAIARRAAAGPTGGGRRPGPSRPVFVGSKLIERLPDGIRDRRRPARGTVDEDVHEPAGGGLLGRALLEDADLVAHARPLQLPYAETRLDRLRKRDPLAIQAVRLRAHAEDLPFVNVEPALPDQP